MYNIVSTNVLFKSQVEAIIKKSPLKINTDIVVTDDIKALDSTNSYYFLYSKDKDEKKEKLEGYNVFLFDSAKDLEIILPSALHLIEQLDSKTKALLEMDKYSKKLETEIEDYDKETRKAYQLQKNIYKGQTSSLYDIHSHFQSFFGLSGDFFFVKTLISKTYVVFGDVTHHGTKAGLYGATVYTLLAAYFNAFQESFISLPGVINYLETNSQVFGKKGEDAVHMLIIEIDHKKGILNQLSLGQAAEPCLLIDKSTSEITELTPANYYRPYNESRAFDIRTCEIDTYKLPKDYALLFYSDGIRELFKSDKDSLIDNQYSVERIKKLVQEHLKEDNLDDVVSAFIDDCNNFSITDNVYDNDTSSKRIMNCTDDITILLLNLKHNPLT